MTTLQTPSTRSTTSATPADLRAQSQPPRAPDAPRFASVLEAFTRPEPDRNPEPTDETPPSEETAESSVEADDTGSPESSESSESSADQSAGVSDEQDTAVVDESTEDETPVEEFETLPETQAPIVEDRRIASAGELAKLLSSAASINLAGLATEQLQGEAASSKPIVNETDTPQRPRPATRADRPSGFDGNAPRTALQSNAPIPAGVSTAPAAFKPIDTQAHQVPDQKPVDQSQSAPVRIDIAQAAQTQTTDQSIPQRPVVAPRTIAEIATVSPSAVTKTDTAGQSGSGNSGLDLGDRSASTAKLMQSKPADDRAMQRQQVLAQVQRGLASIMNTKGGTMKLRLSPEHLGEVNIQLTTKDGRVSVRIDAKNDSTREMLKEGLDTLRSAIESRGATVDELRMDAKPTNDFQSLLNNSGTPQNNQSRSNGNPSEHNPSHDHNHNADDHAASDDQSSTNTPRSIWTDLGLDAIA